MSRTNFEVDVKPIEYNLFLESFANKNPQKKSKFARSTVGIIRFTKCI